ncbi:MAG: TetR/AcrR family transcriptional regulator [Bacteroidetes bacterium]|nr:TetR/AcrR family transcriptional regulator [Bacteroidota bacterium]
MSTQFNETEQAILAAALEEFSKHGRQGARMQDIADRAGLNKALLHYYFRSKERLYEEVFTYVFRHYFTRMTTPLRSDGSFAEILRQFIHQYVDLLNENPALPMFMLREVAEGAPVFRRRIGEIAATHLDPESGDTPLGLPNTILAFFERGVREGAVTQADPFQTMISVMGACIYFFAAFPIFAAVMPGLEQQRAALTEARKDHIFELVYYGLKPRTE